MEKESGSMNEKRSYNEKKRRNADLGKEGIESALG